MRTALIGGWRPILLMVVGVAGIGALFVRFGVSAIAAAFETAGPGIVLYVLIHFVPLFFDTLGWRAVLRTEGQLGFGELYLMRWAGEAVNNLLPLIGIAGELFRATLATNRGVPAPRSFAAIAADLTMGIGADVLVAAASFFVLLGRSVHSEAIDRIAIGLAILVALVAILFAVQRGGLLGAVLRHGRRLVKSARWSRALGSGEALDRETRTLYRDNRALSICALFRLIAVLLGGFETFVALRLAGWPVQIGQAMIVHGLVTVIRAGAFFMPAGLGVQEWSYVAIGALAGIPPDVAGALAIMRRLRDVAIGVPSLIAISVRTRDQ
jgi:putative membrane protein